MRVYKVNDRELIPMVTTQIRFFTTAFLIILLCINNLKIIYMNKITVDQLVGLVKESKSGHNRQEKPIVVWFDRVVGGDILKYAEYGDYIGLATEIFL